MTNFQELFIYQIFLFNTKQEGILAE